MKILVIILLTISFSIAQSLTPTEIVRSGNSYLGKTVVIKGKLNVVRTSCTLMACSEQNPCCNTCNANEIGISDGTTTISLFDGELSLSSFYSYGWKNCQQPDSIFSKNYLITGVVKMTSGKIAIEVSKIRVSKNSLKYSRYTVNSGYYAAYHSDSLSIINTSKDTITIDSLFDLTPITRAPEVTFYLLNGTIKKLFMFHPGPKDTFRNIVPLYKTPMDSFKLLPNDTFRLVEFNIGYCVYCASLSNPTKFSDSTVNVIFKNSKAESDTLLFIIKNWGYNTVKTPKAPIQLKNISESKQFNIFGRQIINNSKAAGIRIVLTNNIYTKQVINLK